jgi:hypothetical protein
VYYGSAYTVLYTTCCTYDHFKTVCGTRVGHVYYDVLPCRPVAVAQWYLLYGVAHCTPGVVCFVHTRHARATSHEPRATRQNINAERYHGTSTSSSRISGGTRNREGTRTSKSGTQEATQDGRGVHRPRSSFRQYQ